MALPRCRSDTCERRGEGKRIRQEEPQAASKSPECSDGGPRRLLIEGLVLGRNGEVVMSLLWPVISWESRGTTDLRNRGAAPGS